MQSPYFSIIIPCLNEEKYLPKLLSNLEKQSFTNFEVIIVDGKSEDKTIRAANKFVKRLNIKLVASQKRNVSHQRNLGAKSAKSEILIFFDADTKIPRNFLRSIHKCFETQNPDAVNTWIKTASKLETYKTVAIGINVLFEIGKIFGAPAAQGAFIAVKKNVFWVVKGFDEKIKFAEDSDLIQKIVDKGFTYTILRNTYYYYSFRRYKKEGTVSTIKKSLALGLNRTFNLEKLIKVPEYHMGGHIFNSNTKPKSLLWLNHTFSNLKKHYSAKVAKKSKAFFQKLLEDLKN